MQIKHVIWFDDIPGREREDEIRGSIAEREGKPVAEVTDGEYWDEVGFLNSLYFEDERANLDRPLDGRVLVIASLGLWDGRRSGYKFAGTNLNAVLSAGCGDSYTVGDDGRDVVAVDSHHDGTNYYTFREVREDRNVDVLLEKLYDGTATRADVNRYTRSLHRHVAEIYGWN